MNTITLTRLCRFCGKAHSITINFDEYEEGMACADGALIQKAFPKLPPDEQEFIKSGICPTCRDSM